MRIPSGVTNQFIYFVAVDATDFTTREVGLSGFAVYRSRNGAAAVAMSTPTVNETDATNMPGVYELLLDEDMSIGAGNDSEELVFHITVAGMAPVTRTIELYRPKITAGNTLGVAADGDISGDMDGSVVGSVASVTAAIVLPSIPANWITAAGIAAAALDDKGNWNVGKAGYSLSQAFPANFADLSIVVSTGLVDITQVAADKVWATAARFLTASTNFNDIAPSEVLNEVESALNAAIPELAQGTPVTTPSLRDAVMLLYMALRNQLDVSTSGADFLKVYNDAGVVITKKALTDTTGDYSEAKMVTGP